MRLFRRSGRDQPDDRPPARGHLAAYEQINISADPAEEARRLAERYRIESERLSQRAAFLELKASAFAEFGRNMTNLADGIERLGKAWAA